MNIPKQIINRLWHYSQPRYSHRNNLMERLLANYELEALIDEVDETRDEEKQQR